MESEDRQAFAAAIQRYYGQERLLEDMAQRTVQYAQCVSWPTIAQAYVDLCQALCLRLEQLLHPSYLFEFHH
ncbi:MAG: hypothetical protein F4184_05725 [Gemmatimonadetes bacterium]|nr:hypothetical protein [Gemmatimonadota bacterium]